MPLKFLSSERKGGAKPLVPMRTITFRAVEQSAPVPQQLGTRRQLVEAGGEHGYELKSKESLAAGMKFCASVNNCSTLVLSAVENFFHFACSFGYSHENFDPEPEKCAGCPHAKAGQLALSYAVAASYHDNVAVARLNGFVEMLRAIGNMAVLISGARNRSKLLLRFSGAH